MKLKPNDVELIIKLKQNGWSTSEIAKLFGVTPRRIQQVLKERKIKKPGRKRKELPQEIVQTIFNLKDKGCTIEEIYSKLREMGVEVSRYLIWRTLKERENHIFKIEDEAVVISVVNVLSYRLIFIAEPRRNGFVEVELFTSLKLADVIKFIDEHWRGWGVVYLSRTPPLVPTRGCDNKLTRHLKRKAIVRWIPSRVFRNIKINLSTLLSESVKSADFEKARKLVKREGAELIRKFVGECLEVNGLAAGHFKQVQKVDNTRRRKSP